MPGSLVDMERLFESVRVLVADDSPLFRQFISSMLPMRPEYRIICEASDGLEAVQRVEELQPDLILLDIGMPNLNGIEVAKRIFQVVPGSKILFLSVNNDADVVGAALYTGAKGYLLKSDAGTEFWPGIEAVLQHKQFLSTGVDGRIKFQP